MDTINLDANKDIQHLKENVNIVKIINMELNPDMNGNVVIVLMGGHAMDKINIVANKVTVVYLVIVLSSNRTRGLI